MPAGVHMQLNVSVFQLHQAVTHLHLLSASISCALKVFITWLCLRSLVPLCCRGRRFWSDIRPGEILWNPPKLLWDQATCYKTFFYRTLFLSAVLSSSSCAEEIWYSFMIALLAITRAHCCAFVNIKGKPHCREISSAFALTKSKKISVFCASYLEITLAVGSRDLLCLICSLSENLTIFISFLARFTDKRNNPWSRTISVLKS